MLAELIGTVDASGTVSCAGAGYTYDNTLYAWGACSCCTHSGLYTSTTVRIQVCMYSQYGAFSGWVWPGKYETVDMCSAIHCQSAGFVKVATASRCMATGSGWH